MSGRLKLAKVMRGGSREKGQVVVIGALMFVVLIGMTGLAVDGGRAYLDRRALQSAADTAADTGMRMLLADYHNQVAPPFSGPAIQSKLDAILAANRAGGSGLDPSPEAAYVDGKGADYLAVSGGSYGTLCTFPSESGCSAGVRVKPAYTHPTVLFRVLGTTTSQEKAVATSRFGLTGPPIAGAGPFVGWHVNCPAWGGTPDQAPVKGDPVELYSPQWAHKHICGPGADGGSSFKGFIRTYNAGPPETVKDCAGNITDTSAITAPSCLDGGAGGALGQWPSYMDIVGNRIVVPEVCAISGDSLTVCGFFAVISNGSPKSNLATFDYACAAGSTLSNCIPPTTETRVVSGFFG